MKYEHADLEVEFIFPPEITQGELELYFKFKREDSDSGPDVSVVEDAAATVRAAAEVGWLNGLDISGLDKWKPAKTLWVHGAIIKEIAQAVTVPKAPS